MEVIGTLSAGASRGWFKLLSMFLWMWQLQESGPGQAEESLLMLSHPPSQLWHGTETPWATCRPQRLPEEATALLLGLPSSQVSPRRSQNQDPSTAECQRNTHHPALANLSLLQPSSPNAGDTAVLFPFSFFLCSILSIRLWLRKVSLHKSHTGLRKMQLR